MKIIKGKEKIALVLTPIEIAYLRVCVGEENHLSRKEKVEKLYPYCARSGNMEDSFKTLYRPLRDIAEKLEEELSDKDI